MGSTVVLEEKWPVFGRHERAAEWLRVWTDLGRAPRTIDAYARGLAEYLVMCDREGVDPVTANRAHEGTLRRRHPDQQSEQMWCLTVATNAIVCWMTEYHSLAVTALRGAGRRIDDEVLAHIWPTHHENAHLYGTHTVDIDGEPAGLDADGYRPLRAPEGHHRPRP